MRPLRDGGVWLGLAGALFLQAGCTGPSILNGMSGVSPAPEAASRAEELPANQAVKACLAVAQSLDKNGNAAGALEQYEKVLQLDAGNVQACRRLAVLYDRRCDFTKADLVYRKAAEARPYDADLLNDWGYSYYLRNQWGGAEKLFRRALAIDDNHARARCNLGLVLGQQGQYEEALQAFRRANLSEADAHCNLGFVYWTQGNCAAARRECETARQLDPTNAKARTILTKLDQPVRSDLEAAALTSTRPGRTVASRPRARPAADRSECYAVLGTPGAAVASTATGGNLPPVYVSPKGTTWVPVSPAPHPSAPAPEDGVPAVVTFD
jgi:Flp pilus assembly protein TadD